MRSSIRKEVDFMARSKNAIPDGYQTVTPVVTFDDGAPAVEWYKKALGAEQISRHDGPDGKIMHAELKIGNARLMLHDAMMGGKGPLALGATTVSFWIYVDDCDTLFARAVAAGGTAMMPVADQFWGDRMGQLKDPYGYTWSIASRKEDLTPEEMAERSRAFFKKMSEQPQPAHS
jgi:PhnB protein